MAQPVDSDKMSQQELFSFILSSLSRTEAKLNLLMNLQAAAEAKGTTQEEELNSMHEYVETETADIFRSGVEAQKSFGKAEQ